MGLKRIQNPWTIKRGTTGLKRLKLRKPTVSSVPNGNIEGSFIGSDDSQKHTMELAGKRKTMTNK